MNGLSALAGSAILTFLLIFQSAILSRAPLLQGSADLILLAVAAWSSQNRVETDWLWGVIGSVLVGYVSVVPMPVYLVGYLSSVGLARLLRQRMWNVPQLIMLLSVFWGTLVVQSLTWISLRLSENPTSIGETLNLILLPSLLLNLLLSIPFFQALSDLARLLYPQPLEN